MAVGDAGTLLETIILTLSRHF